MLNSTHVQLMGVSKVTLNSLHVEMTS